MIKTRINNKNNNDDDDNNNNNNNNNNPYRNCSTSCRAGTRALSWAPSQTTWHVLAGSIGRRVARSGCSGCLGWLDLAVLVAPGHSGWLDLAALGAAGHRFCCTGAVFSLISLRRGSVSSRSPWLLRFGCSVRSWAPWLPRLGALGAFLGDLGTLLGCSWTLLGRSEVPLCRSRALLGALGTLLGRFGIAMAPLLARFGCSVRSWAAQLAQFGAPWLSRFGCKRMPQRLPHRHDKQK